MFAHGIPTPTHKSTILQCTGRREGQKAGRTIGADKPTTHRFGLSGIIESPSTKEISYTEVTFCFDNSISNSILVFTVVLRTKEASAVYRSKMAFFKRAWQKVKVMSRP